MKCVNIRNSNNKERNLICTETNEGIFLYAEIQYNQTSLECSKYPVDLQH